MSLLKNREVFVAYDLDDAGRAGAAKFADAARAADATVYVLDLERVKPR
jgi:DNA primase